MMDGSLYRWPEGRGPGIADLIRLHGQLTRHSPCRRQRVDVYIQADGDESGSGRRDAPTPPTATGYSDNWGKCPRLCPSRRWG